MCPPHRNRAPLRPLESAKYILKYSPGQCATVFYRATGVQTVAVLSRETIEHSCPRCFRKFVARCGSRRRRFQFPFAVHPCSERIYARKTRSELSPKWVQSPSTRRTKSRGRAEASEYLEITSGIFYAFPFPVPLSLITVISFRVADHDFRVDTR